MSGRPSDATRAGPGPLEVSLTFQPSWSKSDAQFDPMPPPTYHPERGGSPAPLWAATPEMEQSTRIPPTADEMTDVRSMENSCTDRPVPGAYGHSTTPRGLGLGRCLARNKDCGPSPGKAYRLLSKADLSVQTVLA